MADLKSRLKPVFRRASTTSSAKSNLSSSSGGSPVASEGSWGKASLRLAKGKKSSQILPVQEEKELPSLPPTSSTPAASTAAKPSHIPSITRDLPQATPPNQQHPEIAIERATPERRGCSATEAENQARSPAEDPERLREQDAQVNAKARPSLAARRHSPISFEETRLFDPPDFIDPPPSRAIHRSGHIKDRSQAYATVMQRKIWVKRPNATATQVSIGEDDLVDDVKDMILRKYANSLGRNFDPPDVTLKVALDPRSSRHTNERALGPDENISKILNMHYPGGQTMDEALLIDVPQRRTPKHSPRLPVPYYVADDLRPGENGTDYFPPMPVAGPHSPHLPANVSVGSGHGGVHRPPVHPHSISVLETGHVPTVPSPGAGGRIRHSDRSTRPRYVRQHTTSPTVISSTSHTHSLGKPTLPFFDELISNIAFKTHTKSFQIQLPYPHHLSLLIASLTAQPHRRHGLLLHGSVRSPKE